MRSPGIIPAEILRRQTAVADPQSSAWVAANAGSGKTHVLAQRVVNLLLAGVEPEKILCITFTKAAAANMAKRVFDTLGRWTSLGDADLDAAIGAAADEPPNPRRRAMARRLFARALETPGGLKVHTIHAFCTQLLHQFPFEADVAARFNVLDDAANAQLLEQLTLAVLLEGAGEPNSALGRALSTAMVAAADQTFRDVVREAIGRRDAFSRWTAAAGGIDAGVAALSKALGVEPALTQEKVEAEIVDGPILPSSDWAAAAEACRSGSPSDQKQCERLTRAARGGGSDRVRAYLDVFLDGKGEPRGNLLTQALTRRRPDLVERLRQEQARVLALHDLRNAVICRERSAALLTVAATVLDRYAAEKARRGLLDYDDLIDRTLAMLQNVDAAWVHFKLDLGIDHVLIDEAQDTSTKQWEIVRRLTAEFTAGHGARDCRRTIFAVGDEKQSIFSFQNAAPQAFAQMRGHFETAHRNAELAFVVRKFEHSFRSGPNILGAVDEVFRAKEIARSMTADRDGFPPHIALPDSPPGRVEIWEPLKPDKRDEIEGWDAPFDTVSETSPRVKLAQKIANTVRGIVAGRDTVGVEPRAARYGDVLILVRQRGPLFEAIIRALKNQGVAVAGADRLVLTDHIAVMDLMALADALLLPQDDLALATVLRSPLFGFTDEELFEIAWDRGRLPLHAALTRKAADRARFADAAARFDELGRDARRETPFAFYARLLGAGGARRRFLARLGVEANDALDEFLNLALDYEQRETPSLQGFIAWLRDARAEVKRDMETARDEVRVMTVHGAKGLEAPIVFLADTMTAPTGPKPPRLIPLAGGPIVWAGRRDDDAAPVAAARVAALAETEAEYRRLLYVAMTRAADRLIVCGAEGERGRPAGCWYDLAYNALQPFLIEDTVNGEKVLRYRHAAGDQAAAAPATAPLIVLTAAAAPATAAVPAWLHRQAPIPARRLIRLSPSAAYAEASRTTAVAAAAGAERRRALQRGHLVHRLMQSLPDVAPGNRKAALERYMAGAAADLPLGDQHEIARQVLTILNDLIFAEAFATGSRAEVPVVGLLANDPGPAVAVSGQIDRLAVTPDSVLMIDYKTDRTAADSLAAVPPAYVAQLALYRAVLARLFRGRTVRAALVFMTGPHVVEVPGPAMDAALAETLARLLRQ